MITKDLLTQINCTDWLLNLQGLNEQSSAFYYLFFWCDNTAWKVAKNRKCAEEISMEDSVEIFTFRERNIFCSFSQDFKSQHKPHIDAFNCWKLIQQQFKKWHVTEFVLYFLSFIACYFHTWGSFSSYQQLRLIELACCVQNNLTTNITSNRSITVAERSWKEMCSLQDIMSRTILSLEKPRELE